jgi:hypothetical protein
LSGRCFFFSAINAAENRISFPAGKKNNAPTRKNVLPGSFRVATFVGFSVALNVIVRLGRPDRINCRIAETAGFSLLSLSDLVKTWFRRKGKGSTALQKGHALPTSILMFFSAEKEQSETPVVVGEWLS